MRKEKEEILWAIVHKCDLPIYDLGIYNNKYYPESIVAKDNVNTIAVDLWIEIASVIIDRIDSHITEIVNEKKECKVNFSIIGIYDENDFGMIKSKVYEILDMRSYINFYMPKYDKIDKIDGVFFITKGFKHYKRFDIKIGSNFLGDKVYSILNEIVLPSVYHFPGNTSKQQGYGATLKLKKKIAGDVSKDKLLLALVELDNWEGMTIKKEIIIKVLKQLKIYNILIEENLRTNAEGGSADKEVIDYWYKYYNKFRGHRKNRSKITVIEELEKIIAIQKK